MGSGIVTCPVLLIVAMAHRRSIRRQYTTYREWAQSSLSPAPDAARPQSVRGCRCRFRFERSGMVAQYVVIDSPTGHRVIALFIAAAVLDKAEFFGGDLVEDRAERIDDFFRSVVADPLPEVWWVHELD